MKRLLGEGLSVSLGGVSILQGVDLRLTPGEMLGIIGPNGAGKTTLLRRLAGLLPRSGGRLMLDHDALEQLPLQQRARRIAYLPQDGVIHWPLTVERLVQLGRLPHLGDWQHPASRDQQAVQRVLRQTGLLQLAGRRLDTLSGGERARALLARALAVEPEILLADEPVAALDPAHQLEVMELLRRACDQGGAVIVVLHDLRLASHYCHRLQLLVNGKTLLTGIAEEVLTTDNLERAYGITLSQEIRSVKEAFALTWKIKRNYSAPSIDRRR